MGIHINDIADLKLRRKIIEQDARQNVKQLGNVANPTIIEPSPAKRVRQDPKPLLNELEKRWQAHLLYCVDSSRVFAQSLRFKLGNGTWYKPDFVVMMPTSDRPATFIGVAYECKGPHSFRGGFENLKVAASQYRYIKWVLVWEENMGWQEQVILP